MGFKVAKSLKFDSLKEQGLKLIVRYGFVIWLWAFLFARVPLAAIQDLFGLQSRPLLLLDCLSVGFALVAFSQVGWRPWKVFQTSIVRVAYLSFALFWAFYSLRLVFDHWILSVDLVTPASTLFKHLLTSTLIPALCLPWILTLASWGSTLPVLVGLGSISLFFGELSFVFITGFDALMKARFAFEISTNSCGSFIGFPCNSLQPISVESFLSEFSRHQWLSRMAWIDRRLSGLIRHAACHDESSFFGPYSFSALFGMLFVASLPSFWLCHCPCNVNERCCVDVWNDAPHSFNIDC